MSGVKPITSYFPVLSKDQLEIVELIDTQSSRNYRTLSLQTAITNSTLSTKVYDAYVDLTKADDLPDLVDCVDDDDDDVDDEVEPAAVVVVVGLGDSIFSALDSVLGPTPLVFSNTQPGQNKKDSREYHCRPHNWPEIADYYQHHRNVAGTVFRFNLNTTAKVHKPLTYWATTFGRWMKDAKNNKWDLMKGQVPVYGTKIDQQLVRVVANKWKTLVSSSSASDIKSKKP